MDRDVKGSICYGYEKRQRHLYDLCAAASEAGQPAGEASSVVSALNMEQLHDSLKKLQDKAQNDAFKIMVVGTFKNGKSTFINSFLGKDILPAYSIPTTAVINEVKYGETKRAVLHFRDPAARTAASQPSPARTDPPAAIQRNRCAASGSTLR